MESISESNKNIFEKFGQRVTSEDFVNCQQEFFEKNASTFKEGAEENTLQSTAVFKDWTDLMDKLLDAYMQE
jgi:hypothetical protein